MYLHLGADMIVPYDEVIGIFDLDNTTASKSTRDFLSRAEREGRIVNVAEDLPKSFVLCDKAVYLSLLAASTLCRRAAQGQLMINS